MPTIPYYYCAFMLLALLVFLLSRHLLPRPEGLKRLPWWKRCLLALAAFVGGNVGAKLPFVLGLDGRPPSLLAWLDNGKTLTTALVAAYLSVELAKLLLDIRVKTGDTFALPLALALAIGRWGCFCNGCCYGTPTSLPWGCTFGDSVSRHPTQAYESFFHLAMALVLFQLLRHRLLQTHHLQLYLIAYGIYRFLTELIRPEPPLVLGLTFYQCISLSLIVGLAAQWALERRAALPPLLSAADR